MRFLDFKEKFQEQVIFSDIDIEKKISNFSNKNLIYWQKKGYILKLRNKLYCFADINRCKNTTFNIANKMYKPSYISLDSALSYYGFIPEGVFLITSITTLKTNNFNNYFGNYVYKTIKKQCFFGYTVIEKAGGAKFSIAEPEKAILDYLYINYNIKNESDFESLRLNKYLIKDSIDFEKMNRYIKLFNSKVLTVKVEKLKRYINV